MKTGSLSVWLAIFVFCMLTFSIPLSLEENYNIPSWVKNNARWWSQGQVGDSDFEKGIEYLIDQKIINIPPQNQTTSVSTAIPSWIKNIAGMWTSGKVSDNEFYVAIQYLVRSGIIHVQLSPAQQATPATPNVPDQNVPPQNPPPGATTQPPIVTVPPATNGTLPTNTSPALNVPSANTTNPAQNMTTTSSANNQTKSNTGLLVGNGVNLKINGNVASGVLTLSGIQYTAPSLLMTSQGSQIQIQGNVQTASTSLLELVGVAQSGNQYNFYGTVSDNGKSIPVQFAATLEQGNGQAPATQPSQAANLPSTPASLPPQPVTKPQVPTLPMLVLYAQSQQVTMGYTYNLAVKTFDPKANPDKTFGQFNGGITGATISGVILDQSNQKLSSFSGLTDRNGLYQYQVLAPYYQGWTQTFKVIINATKSGYTPQTLTFSFVTIYPNQGGTQCSSTIPSAPTGLSATASSSSQINLSWTVSSGATSYTIYRSTSISGPFTTQVGTSTSASFDDTGLSASTTYYYEITASNCAGTSALSTPPASATTL